MKMTYMIVTNDKYEHIVASGLSYKEAAEFVGVIPTSIHKKVYDCKYVYKTKNSKYKVVVEEAMEKGYSLGERDCRKEYMRVFRDFIKSDNDCIVFQCKDVSEAMSGYGNTRLYIKKYKLEDVKVKRRGNLLIYQKGI